MNKKPVHIVGAGFSGLSAAYFLSKAGYNVEVFEKSAGPGGLIHSTGMKGSIAESAANAFLNSALLESVAQEIGVELLPPLPASKARYIFRDGKPTRWPLHFLENLRLLAALFYYVFAKQKLAPKAEQSVATWADRYLGESARKFLLAPALQGIYAGDVESLSATLILGRFFLAKNQNRKGSFHGSTAPKNGMSEFLVKLESFVLSRGVKIHYQTNYQLVPDSSHQVLLAGSAKDSAKITSLYFPDLAAQLSQIEMLPVISVTCFMPAEAKSLQGFGCLFPRGEGVRAMGMLSNQAIFTGRPETETWLFGGAVDKEILKLSDEELICILREDRRKLFSEDIVPAETKIHRWESAIPHYTTGLERLLSRIEVPRGITLFGNYLGNLGLTKILEAASKLPEEMNNA